MDTEKKNDSDKYLVDSYIRYWYKLISDLEKMPFSKHLEEGESAALLLAFCYIESLGKIYSFEEEKEYPGDKKIFIKTLQAFNISKKNAIKIYTDFRCSFVHSGPIHRIRSIRGKDNKEIEIDLEWCIKILKFLHQEIRAKLQNVNYHYLAKSIDWKKLSSSRKCTLKTLIPLSMLLFGTLLLSTIIRNRNDSSK